MGSCRPDVILLNWRFRICDRVNLRALRMGLLLQFVKESSGKLRAAVAFEIGLGLNAESFRSTEDISECLLIIASSVLFLQKLARVRVKYYEAATALCIGRGCEIVPFVGSDVKPAFG